MENKLLPIGSVVLLKDGTKKVMITGFYVMSEKNKETVFDYSACLYPEGVISSDKNLLFNHNQIEQICFMGYENEEEKEFKQKLSSAINEINNAVEINNQNN